VNFVSIFDEILSSDKKDQKTDVIQISSDYDRDPRPDLRQDHHHWVHILTNARKLNFNLYTTLHGIRCGGGRIEETLQAYKILPGDEEWADPTEWERVKQKWLKPIHEDLLKLFKICKIGQIIQEELPPGVFQEKPKEKPAAKAEQISMFGR
jgi:hypothetical protein